MITKKVLIILSQVLNGIILVGFFGLMLMLVGFGGLENKYSVVMFIGYWIALIFWFLSFKRYAFMVISVFGWVLVWYGNHLEQIDIKNQRYADCMDMRKDPACVEDEHSAMNCNGSIDAYSCVGIPK